MGLTMKIRTLTAIVFCLLAYSTTPSAETRPSGYAFATAPTPAVTLPPTVVDSMVKAMGLEPDSEAGRVATRWFKHAFSDPDLREPLRSLLESKTTPTSDTSRFPLGMSFSADQRVHFIRSVLHFLSSLTSRQCATFSKGQGYTTKAISQLSPVQLDEMFGLIEWTLKTSVQSHTQHESYTTEQLLDADNAVEMHAEAAVAKQHSIEPALLQDPPALLASRHACGVVTTMLKTLLQTAEPTRSIATWDLLSSPWAGFIFQHLLRNPDQYIDQHFDVSALPPHLVEHLPAAGSRPLGYKRIVVDADWENRSTPSVNGRYQKTYWNLHDTGVVATASRGLDDVGNPTSGSFATEYGEFALTDQTIGSGYRVVPPSRFPSSDYPTLDGGGPIPQPNSKYREPVPQPSRERLREIRCETFEKYPASTIEKDLTGDAVDVSCQAIWDKGVKYESRDSYLYDYNISIRRFEIDSDGLSVLRIRNITVTR